MYKRFVLIALTFVIAAAAATRADDWNQWRGPTRTAQAGAGPALADQWPKDGPPRLWQSEKIPSGNDGGFGTVAFAAGRAYLYVNWKTREPIATRTLSADGLKALGWSDLKLPDNLLAAVEQTRTSKELAALKGEEVGPWVDQWVVRHVPDANDNKDLAAYVRQRILQRDKALPLDVLAKLAAIKDKEFSSPQELDKWFAASGIAADLKNPIAKKFPATRDSAQDVVVCLDGASGKTLWKKEFPGHAGQWGSSSTPCIVGGRCYVAGARALYCLDAADGNKLWSADTKGKEISSSPVVVDGVVSVLCGSLTGFSAADGKELWSEPNLAGNNPSPAVWTKDGRSYLVANSNQGIGCVDPRTGKLLWTAPGGGNSTVAISGDTAVVLSEKKDIGLAAYKLSVEKAEKLWSVQRVPDPSAATAPADSAAPNDVQDVDAQNSSPATAPADPNDKSAFISVTDRGTSPIIYDGYVYIVGAKHCWCFSLADGKPAWMEKCGNVEISSPIEADGKIFATPEGKLMMFQASPRQYQLLAKSPVTAARVSSPSLADGKLLLRGANGVACYDLTKPQK